MCVDKSGEYKQLTRGEVCAGMMRPEDIQAVNEIKPEYIGFRVLQRRGPQICFLRTWRKCLKEMLDPAVKAVGVFVNEPVEKCG